VNDRTIAGVNGGNAPANKGNDNDNNVLDNRGRGNKDFIYSGLLIVGCLTSTDGLDVVHSHFISVGYHNVPHGEPKEDGGTATGVNDKLNEAGIANFISLAIVEKYFQAHYDGAREKAFVVEKLNRSERQFLKNKDGLYCLDTIVGSQADQGMVLVTLGWRSNAACHLSFAWRDGTPTVDFD
jgi:hypothetical protein